MLPSLHLRPMEFGDVLDGAFKLYRAEFVRMFSAALLVSLPQLVFEVWAAASVDTGDPMAMAMLTAARLPVAMVTVVLAYGIVTYQGDGALHGRPAGALQALRGFAGRIPALLTGYLLAWLAMLVGLLFLVVPMFILGFLFFAVAPAVVVERLGPLAALRRSWRLARGALGHIAAVLIVASIISLLPSLALGVATGALLGAAAGAAPAAGYLAMNVAQVLLSALVNPFTAAVVLLLYYDRRVRTEALDVQAAAERLPQPAPV